MHCQKIVIATRESPLALRQAEIVRDQLLALNPKLIVSLLGLKTTGDKKLDSSLAEIGGKGLFVKELEEAMFEGKADIAVHSIKDVPMDLPAGLCLAAIGKREDPRDVFVSNHYDSLKNLPKGAVIGTSSLRRQIQLQILRPDLVMKNLRGNIHTRLKRLDENEMDAIILAAAGLHRLQLDSRIKQYFSTDDLIPSAGQGALGLECRENDRQIYNLLTNLSDPITTFCVLAERELCRRIGGGCTVPLGSFAEIQDGNLTLNAFLSNKTGSKILRTRVSGKPMEAEEIGRLAANNLITQGAQAIIKEFRQ